MKPKYQWTDWITHIPGQELPAGAYGIFEFCGDDPARFGTKPGVPYEVEGAITPALRGHPCWRMTNDSGSHCRLIRYKLRSESCEAEHDVGHQALAPAAT